MAKQWKKKYEFYVCGRGWVRDFNPRGLMAGERRRYRTDTFYGKEPIKLTVEEVCDCIEDCNDKTYNNKSFIVEPADEFLVEYEEFIKTVEDEYKYRNINKKNPLKHQKRTISLINVGIERNYYEIYDSKKHIQSLGIFYNLRDNNGYTTSMIVNYKKNKNEYMIETANSFYKVEEITEPSYHNVLDELDKYLKSKEFKQLKQYLKQREKQLFDEKIIKEK